MTGFNDWTEIGWFPLQDFDPAVTLGMRYQMAGARISSAGDPSSWSTAEDGVTRYALVSGMGSLGDIGQWGFWQTKDRASRDTGTWSQSVAVLTTKMLQRGRYGTEIQPIRDAGYRNDLRYAPKAIAPPRALPMIPAGMVQLLVPGREDRAQAEFVLHTDPRLVCPSTEGPAECGTLVVDLQPAGELCMGEAHIPGRGGRHARLQTIFRVVAFDQRGLTSIEGSEFNLIALNYTKAIGGEGGFGAIFTKMDRGLLRPTTGGGGTSRPTTGGESRPPPPATGPGSTGFQGGAHGPVTFPTASPSVISTPPGVGGETTSVGPGREQSLSTPGAPLTAELETGSGAFGGGLSSAGGVTQEEARAPFLFGRRPTQKKRPEHGVAFMAALGPGGPIHGGTMDDDRHYFGDDADGHPCNAAHIWTQANFFRDKEKDGPLLFEGDYPDVVSHPIPSPVHLTWDEDASVWRWWCEVPDMDGGGEPEPTREPGAAPPPPERPSTPGPSTPGPSAPTTPGPAQPRPQGGRPTTPGPGAPPTPGPGGTTPPPGGRPTTPGPGSPGVGGAGGTTPPPPGPGGGGGSSGPTTGPSYDPTDPTTWPSGPRTPGPSPGTTPDPDLPPGWHPPQAPPPPWLPPSTRPSFPWAPYRPAAGPAPQEPERPTFLDIIEREQQRRREHRRRYGTVEEQASRIGAGAEFGPERPGSITRVGETSSEMVGHYQVFSPFMRSFAAVAFRPQLWIEGYPSFEHNPRASMPLLREEERSRPQVLTMRSWGAQVDGDWSYTKRPELSRARGGEAFGGTIFTPPQYELEDYFGIGSTLDTDPEGSADRYVLSAPGVAMALGTPNLDGGLGGGSVVLRQNRNGTNREFEIRQLTDARTSELILSAEVNLSTGVPSLAAKGNLGFPDNKGILLGTGEDAFLFYNGTNVVLTPDVVGSGLILLNGNVAILDNDVLAFGNATDARIAYDGTDLVINPRVVGTGLLEVAGGLNVNTTVGTLRPPRLTTTQRGSLTAVEGDVIYNTTTDQLELYDGTEWAGLMAKQGVLDVDGSATLVRPQRLVNADATSAAFTITLFPAADGEEVNITKIDSSANAVTIDGDGSETINGQLTQELSSQYESLTLYSDGTEWFIK